MRCKGQRGRSSTTAARVTRAPPAPRRARAARAGLVSVACRAEQVPPVTGDIGEDGDSPVGFGARRAAELHAGGRHPPVGGIEVINPEEEPDTAADLVPG